MGNLCANNDYKQSGETKQIDKELRQLEEVLKNEIRVLLLGTGESGKSTVFKQMKILQDKGGFQPDELVGFRTIIRGNCISQMKLLCSAVSKLGVTFDSDAHAQYAQQLSQLESGDWSPQVATMVAELWSDSGVQAAFGKQGYAFQLDDSASYLFQHINRISADDYMPSIQDVLRARTRTTGVDEAIFVFKDMEFRMIDVGGQRSERRKWISVFDCVTAVLFCVSLAEYDQVLREDRTQNRMKESLLLFEEIYNNPIFSKIDFIIFFNKKDIFPQKLARSPLTICFPDYPGNPDPEFAMQYIAQRFLELRNLNAPHRSYHHFTCAIDPENMKTVFGAVRKTLLDHVVSQTQI